MRQERVVGMAREGAARRTVHTSVSSRDRTKKAHRRVDLVLVLETEMALYGCRRVSV